MSARRIALRVVRRIDFPPTRQRALHSTGATKLLSSKPFRMRTYELLDLKPLRMNTCRKRRGDHSRYHRPPLPLVRSKSRLTASNNRRGAGLRVPHAPCLRMGVSGEAKKVPEC